MAQSRMSSLSFLSSIDSFSSRAAARSLGAAIGFIGASGLFCPSFAFAQDAPAQDAVLEEGAAPSDLEGIEDEDLNEPAPADETVPAEQESAAEATPKKKGEGKSAKALLIGLRHRMIVVPKWLVNSFGLDGGKTFVTQGFGGEVGGYFGEAANGFMVLGSVWWAPYHVDNFLFKGRKDADTEWEVIESNLNSLYITLDAAWDFRLIDKLSLNVGMGVGVGVVTGQLYRDETYLNNLNPQFPAKGDQPGLSTCAGPGNPSPADCPADGTYGRSNRWPVYPWLNFQMGLRYQVVDEFAARFDLGVGSSGFWLGIGADYSLWL